MKILLALVTCLSVTWTAPASGQDAFDAALPRQVEVIRTAYGVPHIYADTLRALGYALGYLQSEDYGDRVARGLLRARGELALHEGRGALDSDFASRPSFTRAMEAYPALHPGHPRHLRGVRHRGEPLHGAAPGGVCRLGDVTLHRV